MASLLPRGYYFNPIDQGLNPYHSGQWTFRQIFNTVCSTHVTVSQATGQVSTHIDTVNPVPGWALLVAPAATPAIWTVTFGLHAALDMGKLLPASVACSQ
jgi:hypothetical protein